MNNIVFCSPKEKFGELSNFFDLKKEPIVWNGKTYKSSEHLYQALKYMHPNASQESIAYAEEIRISNTPYKSKLLGHMTKLDQWGWQRQLNEIIRKYQEVGVQMRSDWDRIKLYVMEMILYYKFMSNSKCKEALLSTGKAVLVEHSTTDAFWGDAGEGRNWMGALLMIVRHNIRHYEGEVKERMKKFI